LVIQGILSFEAELDELGARLVHHHIVTNSDFTSIQANPASTPHCRFMLSGFNRITAQYDVMIEMCGG
jgi:hypothetical protein